MFDHCHSSLIEQIKSLGGTQLPLDSDLAEQSNPRKGAVIRSSLWQAPGIRRWRVTQLDGGDAVQVLNAVAYPEFGREEPILGIDLLGFAVRDKLVAVMDFQPLEQGSSYAERYLCGLKAIQARHPSLAAGEAMRAYDADQYFSPFLLFARGSITELEPLVEQSFQEIIQAYAAMHLEAVSTPEQSDRVETLQRAYDQYSAERDPAHGLFTSYFGEEWSNRFMRSFLFPLSSFVSTPVKHL
ncbi:15,16-dihydrobiliverdin:ferredoxin oxidoreductase [Synechococcus sp. CS-602]|uniref:15,16-dihydrobiliverdin:ferredoxin oxidoreductase n=1 Tax=unclassified Synechococcus TaxID=2626047 RepID=UPI0021A3E776|nr:MULTISPECIES: 15,16-dihydrobiliverdin:ferredoxin oxidoreductase [unclassified Synechococcus]MCT0201746.1 15,16-dihydrobiliverdin:ferredoxin oxidoreductase [Synechococcus sp. CS-603]MCT0205688.1 15,16-dihydrobiliverdin:ferredoxin oxidoreductase [Synechococcus sp. CS-602]